MAAVMSLGYPAYWLAYVPESTETGPPVITAVAPAVLPREQFSVDTRGMLAAADAFHVHHPCQRVVFAGAVTRWLHGKGFEWTDLGVDFFQPLRELDEHALALAIDVTPLAMAVVGSAASHCTIHWADGGYEPIDRHVEPVRAALLQVLECDWPAYVRPIAGTAASAAAPPPEASL
jgi:hypothetical protein